MPEDEYDIAGFSVGFVDYEKIIDGRTIKQGDVIIGLTSAGLHSNGFSLVRKIFAKELSDLGAYSPDLGCTLGEELLRPTKVYVKPLLHIIRQFGADVKGISHITGGGFYENIPRMLPDGVRAFIETPKLLKMPIFEIIRHKGNISAHDMFNTFNMGAGMVLAVSADKADEIMRVLLELDEQPFLLGTCSYGERGIDLLW